MTITALQKKAIAYVDLLPDLRKKLTQGRQLYPVDENSHPNQHGYDVMARSIHQYLWQKQWCCVN